MSSLGAFGPTGKSSGLRGTGYRQITMPTQNAHQQQLAQMLHGLLGQGGFQQGLGQLGDLASGSEEAFGKLEAPALRQFGQLQGSLASRFSGMGSGARRSSGFQNTAGEAGASLAEQLQSQRMGYQQSALQQLLGLSESLLGRPTFQSGFAQKKTPFWQELLGGLAGVGGQAAGTFGGLGAAKWAGLM